MAKIYADQFTVTPKGVRLDIKYLYGYADTHAHLIFDSKDPVSGQERQMHSQDAYEFIAQMTRLAKAIKHAADEAAKTGKVEFAPKGFVNI